VRTRPLKPTAWRRSVGSALGLLFVTLALPAQAGAAPPVPEFTFAPATPRIGEDVLFTSQTIDPDEDLSTQAWDLDGDGAFDDGTGFTVTTNFTTGGPHTVSLQATDLAGEVATVSHVVTVNFPPDAVIAFSPASPKVGQPVNFRSDSTDPDGAVVATEWDLDNDGAFDDGSSTTAHQRFTTAGVHVVRLSVLDDAGDQTVATAEVTVSSAAAAPALAPDPTPLDPAPDPRVPSPTAVGTPPPAATFNSAGPPAPAIVPRQTPVAARRPTLLLSPFPIVRISGTFAAGWVRLRVLSVRAPSGTRIVLRCSGATCPVRSVVRIVRPGRTLVRFRMMERRRLRAGVVIRIAVTKQNRIGKYTRFVLRRNAAPARRDTCMRFGATRPSACPVQ
jgi:PKD repeat protein